MTSATSAPSANKRAPRGFTPGFTLVELLVVIGIIVLLIGILVPVVVRAMRQGQRARTASDLNAIATALEAYKAQFDYPRLIYTSAPLYNGTGAGAALLGKALLGQGDASSKAFDPTATYTSGQIVLYGGTQDWQATQTVPAGNTPGIPSSYWVPITLGSAADGADGPGFRLRAAIAPNPPIGMVYGPYLQPDKFKTLGLAIVDSFGNPILYYAANPAHPTITVQGNAGSFGPASAGGGVGSSYVGTAQGVTPGASPTTPAAPCVSLYNYSDNDTVALNAGEAPNVPFIPAFSDISVMEAMLGDYSHAGYIAPGETPATTAAYLLWSAGPDGIYGPVGSNNVVNFTALPPTAVKNLVNKCDDVTNFSFAQ